MKILGTYPSIRTLSLHISNSTFFATLSLNRFGLLIARRDSYPEPYVSPYEPVDPQKKVVKILRRKIVEPGFEPTSQIAESRVDRQNPLFRGSVEQVLDNRNLQPELQPEEYLAPGNNPTQPSR